jgi:hypothetical protein
VQEPAAEGLINADALERLANSVPFMDKARLARVVQRARHGADIGCRGHCRTPTFSSNAPDAYQNGRQVSDAVAGWLAKGLITGPVDEDELPCNAKVSGMMTRTKPDGSVRIILNLSAPKGLSVNDGIDSDEFPAKMSSTDQWLAVLNNAGIDCWMSKTDWADAYKHIPVREEDKDLQWFHWGGKFFREDRLVFGSASSAGIFDDAAKTVLSIVCHVAAFPRRAVCQHLDDACAAHLHKHRIVQFDKAFEEVAAQVGVKLAPKDNPDKAFAASQSGIVFGVYYDTVSWTWRIPGKKLAAILNTIHATLQADSISAKEMKSLAGKLINIKPLVPTAKYNIDNIMRMLALSSKSDPVQLDQPFKRQLALWLLLLRSCSSDLAIPDPSCRMPPWTHNIFTDAAGGTIDTVGRGCGGVYGPKWFYLPWSRQINSGAHKVGEKKVGRKLAALELIGPLIAVSCWFPLIRQLPVTIWVDNAGSVGVWKKGYSNSCPLCSSIVTAISAVAAAAGARVCISKITRCSSEGAIIADHISKAEFAAMRLAATSSSLDQEPATIPPPLLLWAQKPTPDPDLGHRILAWLAKSYNVIGYSSATANIFPV